MKVLVVGSGGREHALVWKIAQSKRVKKIFCAPGNTGTESLAENVSIAVDDLKKLLQFAKKEKIDLTVVGPESPLISGICDLFKKHNLPIVGPTKKAARLEGSKIFAKKLMKKYGIPTSKFEVFGDYDKALKFLKRSEYPLVIKADGQCAGKGVAICRNFKQAESFLKKLMVDKIFDRSGSRVIIEECLTGQEVSFTVATDGDDFVSLLPSQDHKRVFDDDIGPNTGGMGAYAPVPFVNRQLRERIEHEIVSPVVAAMRKEGYPYKGILYPGLILTSAGPKVLEFNSRFGDPETQPLMMLLKSDIIDIFASIVKNKVKSLRVKWLNGYAICVVLTVKGYPGEYEKGKIIHGLTKKTLAFQAGTKMTDGKIVTNGGRVLGVTGTGQNLASAIRHTYKYIGKRGIHFSGMHYRRDIGKKGL